MTGPGSEPAPWRDLTPAVAVLSSILVPRSCAHSVTELTKTAALEAPDPIDVDVGRRIKLRRTAAGVTQTELAVTIKDRASGQALWEGRASFTVSARSPLASGQLGAAKMAEALFKGFPGRSGETIEVR